MFSNGKYASPDGGQSWRFGLYGDAKADVLTDDIDLYDHSPRVNYYDDKENFDNIQIMHADILEGCSQYADGSSFREKLDMSLENSRFTDLFNISTNEADFTEDFRIERRDQYVGTGRFCDLDFASQKPKHRLSENWDVLNSDDSNYFVRNKFTNAAANWSNYAYLKADDPMDNFSSLSGESCSSSAVKGDGFVSAPSARKSLKRSSAFDGSPSKHQKPREDFFRWVATKGGQQEKCEKPRAYTRRSCNTYPLSPVHAVCSDFRFPDTFGQVDDWSNKSGFPPTNIHVARHTELGSSYRSSDKDHVSGQCRPPVVDDISCLRSGSNFQFDSHQSFGGCKGNVSKYFSSFPESGCSENRKASQEEIATCAQYSDSTKVAGRHEDKDIFTELHSADRNSHQKKMSHEPEISSGSEGTVKESLNPLHLKHEKLSKKLDDVPGRMILENDDYTSSFIGLSDNSGSRASEKEFSNNNLDLTQQQLDSGAFESEPRRVESE